MTGEHSTILRVGSALAYAIASISIIFVNKILLTNLGFPSFLFVGCGQMISTVVILHVASDLGLVKIPDFDVTIIRKIFPLPLIYALNLVSGLGGTQKLSLPMLTVLRRFSILMTMILEYFMLGVKPSAAIKGSIFLMVLGAIIAALYDLSFDTLGYILVSINNVCTASNGVYMKKKLEAKELGKYGLLYYNALFMVIPVILLTAYSGDLQAVYSYAREGSIDSLTFACLLLSFICGFFLNYSIVMCTHYNSALTTACVGPIKNFFVTYVGMFTSDDYKFAWNNFVGINVSVIGSFIYAYVVFIKKSRVAPSSAARLSSVHVHDQKALI